MAKQSEHHAKTTEYIDHGAKTTTIRFNGIKTKKVN